MEFTDNNTWFTILLVLHVFGAIAGIGPSFAFSVLGPMSGKDPAGALYYLKGIIAVEKAIVLPVAWFFQPLTGALLIFNRSSIRSNFWQEEWLVVSIVLYIAILIIAKIDVDVMHWLVGRLEAGEAGTPEFAAGVKKTQTLGPIMGVLTIIIAILMIWKPLSECAGPLLRC